MSEIWFAHDQQESPVQRTGALGMAGHDVTLFRSGAELVAALAQHRPALVLLDVLLVGPHGFDVCRLIRHQHAASALPIVMMSDVYRSRVFRDEAQSAGAQAYLLRPLRTDELVAEIARQIERCASRSVR